MSRAIPLRRASRLVMTGLGSTVCVGSFLRSSPIRMDSLPQQRSASIPFQQERGLKTRITPEVVKQLSGGSVTGFCTGVVLAMFSRTLVFLSGLFAISCYVGARYGIDIPEILRVRKLLDNSALWKRTAKSPYFAASFVVTFILAAFAQL